MFLSGYNSETRRVNAIINRDANTIMSDEQLLEKEIQKFLVSPVRGDMITGEAYFIGDHDIIKRRKSFYVRIYGA